MEEKEGQRLHVYLARCGVSSRRAAEGIIAEGRVSVNGRVVRERGSRVLPGDAVFLDGKKAEAESRALYIALNKPPGYICAAKDPQGRPLALDLLKGFKERLYSAGRLDFASCGLIIFTNDGQFASRLGHPSYEIEKEYVVEATSVIPQAALEAFSRGITIENVRYKAASAQITGAKTMRVTLIEGKNREIRKVFSHFRLHARLLRRVRIGPVEIGNLREGSHRGLTDKELAAFRGGNFKAAPPPEAWRGRAGEAWL